jgi:hypothetical protein
MLQFPAPLRPGEIPRLTCFEQFILCVALVAISTALLSFFLPHPLFCKLFKIAFPFMPERIGDDDAKD